MTAIGLNVTEWFAQHLAIINLVSGSYFCYNNDHTKPPYFLLCTIEAYMLLPTKTTCTLPGVSKSIIWKLCVAP